MEKENLRQNNSERIQNRYTPEEEKELDELADEFVDALNSVG